MPMLVFPSLKKARENGALLFSHTCRRLSFAPNLTKINLESELYLDILNFEAFYELPGIPAD